MASEVVSQVARRVPELVVILILVYLFLGQQDHAQAERVQAANACHDRHAALVLASNKSQDEHSKTNRDVRDALVEVATLIRGMQ